MAPVHGEELQAVPANEFSRRGGNRSRRTGVGPEPKMSVPQSVADILNHHVTFQLEFIDRMYMK